MISQRAARPSGSVEKLRQLSLSNLRGVDETCAPTDVYSVDRAVNLVSNSDGSLSVRKPLLIERDWTRIVSEQIKAECTVLDVVPLYTETDYFIHYASNATHHVAIYDSVQNVFKAFTLYWSDANGYERSEENFSKSKNICETITFDNMQPFNVSGRTVFGNCTVWLNSNHFIKGESEYFLCDPSLYDGVVEGSATYKVYGKRYTYLQYNTESAVWGMYIHNTVSNVWENDGAGYVHPQDVSLDNMYSISDEYDMPVPAVTQIVPYASVVQTGDQQTFKEVVDDEVEWNPKYVQTVAAATGHVFSHDVRPVQNLTPDDLDLREYSEEYVLAYGKNTATNETLWRLCVREEYMLCRVQKPNSDGYYVPVVVSSAKDIKTWMSRIFVWIDVLSDTVNTIQVSQTSLGSADIVATRTVEYNHSVRALSRQQSYVKKGPWSNVSKGTRIDLYVQSEYSSTPVSSHFSKDLPYPIEYLSLFTDVSVNSAIQITTTATATTTYLPQVPVSKITRDNRKNAFKGVSYIPNGFNSFYLKAFCKFRQHGTFETLSNNLPTEEYKNVKNVYATWLYTLDGMNWQNAISAFSAGSQAFNAFPSTVTITERVGPVKSIESEGDPPGIDVTYAPFDALGYVVEDGTDNIQRAESIDTTRIRVDFLRISDKFFEPPFTNATFRFKIVLVESVHDAGRWTHTVTATYSQSDYTLPRAPQGEAWFQDFNSSVSGNKLYHSRRIFSFGDATFGTNVFVSDPGEFTTPFRNTLDVNALKDTTVSAVLPWKDYLFVSTPQALYLTSQVENGYLTKTINTSVGIPVADRKCVVATLNGVMFKSDSKIYVMYPNLYAGDDSVANVTVVSSPIASTLEESVSNMSGTPFAFSTESEYVLMVPENDFRTTCFRYDYITKRWNCTRFPILVEKHVTYALTDIRLFGKNSARNYCEYHYDKTFKDAYFVDISEKISYGDILSESEDGIANDIQKFVAGDASAVAVTPIEFELDTGQKSDQILTKKQFVETKIVLSTVSHSPAIDMTCTIHVGGNASVVVKDISTDSAFWKKEAGGMVLNTSGTGFGNADAKDVLRQIVLRYSGKGNSIRHIITGKSLSNFSLYETYVRYKLLNVKQ